MGDNVGRFYYLGTSQLFLQIALAINSLSPPPSKTVHIHLFLTFKLAFGVLRWYPLFQ